MQACAISYIPCGFRYCDWPDSLLDTCGDCYMQRFDTVPHVLPDGGCSKARFGCFESGKMVSSRLTFRVINVDLSADLHDIFGKGI